MRPIELTLQGLHSFRDKQTVDFSSLCEGGVFGIFGPTGSGKSSILDAMTLSLYGKVERAPGNTQGILNHAEEQLAVSFTFSLGKGKRENTYKVERTFKRTKENGLRQATARLINVTENSAVIADKAGDVTKEAESLLGLSIDDFTRAVVLPQGKFSEFLSLKGTERRKMLQRLFHLEKYGDELNQKLRHRLVSARHEKELIEKEQAGLGEASMQSLKKAESHVAQLQKQIEKQEKEVEVTQKDYEKGKQKREWHKQLQLLERELANLEKQAPEIAEKKENIKLAKEANILFPYIQEVSESEEQLNHWQKKETIAQEQLKSVKQEAEASKQTYDKAFKEQEEHEVPIKLLLENFRQMEGKQKDLQYRQKEANEKSYKCDELSKDIEKLSESHKQVMKNKQKYEEVQANLKSHLAETEPATEEKNQMKEAADKRYKLKFLEDQIEETKERLEKASKDYGKAEAAVDSVNKSKMSLSDKLKERFRQISLWYNFVEDKKTLLDTLKAGLTEIQEREKQNYFNSAVNELRRSLNKGEACPVCGSRDHHSSVEPAHMQAAAASEIQEADNYEALEEEIRMAERQFEESVWRLDQTAKQAPFADLSPDRHETDESQDVLPPLEDSRFPNAWNEWKTRWESQRKSIDHLISRFNSEIKEWTKINEETSGENLLLQQAKQRYSDLEKELEDKRASYKQELANWQKQFPQIPYKEVEQILEKFHKREEESEATRSRLENSVPVIDECRAKAEKVNDQLQSCKVEYSKYESEYNEQIKRIEEIRREIETVTKGEELNPLIQRYEQKLNNLIANTSNTKEHLEKAENDFRNAETALNECRHAIKEAEERHARALARWREQKKDSSFTDIEEVQHYRQQPEKLEQWEQDISGHEDKFKEISMKYKELQTNLNDVYLTEEDLTVLEQRFKEAKVEMEQLRTSLGAAEHQLEDIKQKMERYESLETKRKEYEHMLDQLTKLDKVFRGKEFVDFIAEEQLVQVSRLASERLRVLTRGRYAIEVDSGGGFIMRDDANGGVKRPVSTLSGGETFLTSLALALSLSASIQLKGEHSLEFFFLDEGFGTLDPELLETVVSALEQLHTDHLAVGVISHVPELKERLPRKLLVTPAEPGGKGSTIKLENL
ncbi:AAA family ATPase [Salipaludibacillus aurantiacus]|uniref:Nuclease SbcCD subunit C n=1 Tax=Salipaludibacillus aurantiacus TaxID=1601833 RepID=A0A1H9VUD9_9BACI|nr:SMC family ATPase [Salipaludibacillus aurantiacus]SES24977.1 exonuclease SbcC [Salipaludibacillus aurantiacus]